MNAGELGDTNLLLAVILICGLCPLKAKLAWDPLKVFSNTGMAEDDTPTLLLSRTDFRDPKVVGLTSFFPLSWVYSSKSMGSCFTATVDVVTTLVEAVIGGATTEGTLTELTTRAVGGVTTVAEMDFPLVFNIENGYSFIIFCGFCCFTEDDPVTHLCGNQCMITYSK